jgi:hypothetical protein
MLKTVCIVVFAMFVVTAAEAQELAGTFEQLRVLVKTGDTLTVTDNSGEPVRGKLAKLSAGSLVLDVSGTSREFHSIDVNTIEKRGSDSLKNGALIGMAVGGGLAAIAMGATLGNSDANAGVFVVGALLYGGIGAGIGVGIDALVEGRRVIYASSGSARNRITVAPIFDGRRKGAVVSLRLTR